MTALSVHEACEIALKAGRCRWCGAFRGEPCIHPAAGQPAGLHMCRFGAAAVLGMLTASDLTEIIVAWQGHGPIAPDSVIWDGALP